VVNGFVSGFCFEASNFFIQAFESEIAVLPLLLAIVYINLYGLLPAFFARKKYITYFLGLTILVAVTAILMRLIHVYYVNERYPDKWDQGNIFALYYLGRIIILNIAPALIITTVIKLCQYWYYEQKASRELMEEKLAAELNYLKAQVHPHFLFNTLNNLYSLTLSKSDQAPPVLLKLSELMSYMLYDSQEQKIALEKEIAHVRNYIDLERIRYGKRLDVSFNVHGSTNKVYIPPLLLIPFVENAFKHGASNRAGDAWITIDLKIKERGLAIKVENSKSALETTRAPLNYRNGIGLRNVKRRLDLLYPGKFDLAIEDEAEHYAVDLQLTLTENPYE
jgi:sensor histidine kinase YesM